MRQMSSVKPNCTREGVDVRSWQPMTTAAVGWMHQLSEGDLGGALTASTTSSFSYLEETAFHIGCLI